MHWSVIYGDQEAWFLKYNFMKGFVKSVMTSFKFRHEEVVHCASYKDINIHKVECVCVCVSGLRLRLGYCKCMRYQSLVPSR
jgi:hypothetical protein